MLPVRTCVLLVATIPVPASPSGGATMTPAIKSPVGSNFLAPAAVK